LGTQPGGIERSIFVLRRQIGERNQIADSSLRLMRRRRISSSPALVSNCLSPALFDEWNW